MIEQFRVGGFDKNFAYVVHSASEAYVVDPSGDMRAVYAFLEKERLHVVGILLTHSHFDHHDKLPELLERHDVPVHAHTDAQERLGYDVRFEAIQDATVLTLEELALQVLHTPGHVSDAVCFYCKKEGWLITGDTLFVEGVGRVRDTTDAQTLLESLMCLKELPADTRIYPGHDYGSAPNTTLSHEYAHNRFYRAIEKGRTSFFKERLGEWYTPE